MASCYRYCTIAYANCTFLNNSLANVKFYSTVVVIRWNIDGRMSFYIATEQTYNALMRRLIKKDKKPHLATIALLNFASDSIERCQNVVRVHVANFFFFFINLDWISLSTRISKHLARDSFYITFDINRAVLLVPWLRNAFDLRYSPGVINLA